MTGQDQYLVGQERIGDVQREAHRERLASLARTGTTRIRHLNPFTQISRRPPATRVIVVLVAVALPTLAAGAAAAKAASTLPPILTFPAAGSTAPPSAEVSDPDVPDATCSAWYRQGSYVGQPTGSTWWEYYCHHVWPADGSGATNADHGGQDVFDDYFYWDGSAPVSYGSWAFYGYWDSMITASDCSYWRSATAARVSFTMDSWLAVAQASSQARDSTSHQCLTPPSPRRLPRHASAKHRRRWSARHVLGSHAQQVR